MKATKVLVMVLGLSLMGTGTLWAGKKAAHENQPATTAAAKAPADKVQVASGEVVSLSDTNLVLSHKVKGKAEQTTYAINGETKKVGDPQAGVKATVHYKAENGQDVATLVKVKPVKAAKAAKTATSTPAEAK